MINNRDATGVFFTTKFIASKIEEDSNEDQGLMVSKSLGAPSEMLIWVGKRSSSTRLDSLDNFSSLITSDQARPSARLGALSHFSGGGLEIERALPFMPLADTSKY
jgi:hypothetical protein